MKKGMLTVLIVFTAFVSNAHALARPDIEFKIFQFPANMIPRIDADTGDWDMVGEEYKIGTDQLSDTSQGHGTNIDREDIDVTLRLGWVEGMNRLYVLYEVYDDFWDFQENGRHADIFELVIDGDLSGGPLTKHKNPNMDVISQSDLHFSFHGVHAQNHHIFTPPGNKDWNFVWGCPQWTKDLPYANYAYSDYSFKHGEDGHLVLEFWITPFDYASWEGPEKSVVTELEENELIGISWSILDYDGPGSLKGFWNLSHSSAMAYDASELCAFRLMPLEEKYRDPVECAWTFMYIDMDRRVVAFKDESYGKITKWEWDFGDGTTSNEQHPIHTFPKAGEMIVVLTVEGPDGTGQLARVRDIVIK